MEIEHRGLAIDVVDASNRPARNEIRQQAEIAAAAGGPVGAEHAHGRHGELEHARRALVRESRRVRHAVVIVANRIDARAVAISGLVDAVECPRVARPDREARRAVAADAATRNILQHGLRESDIGQEFAALLLGRAQVRKAMAGKLVTGIGDPADQVGIPLGDPAEREECRAHIGFVEQARGSDRCFARPGRAWCPNRLAATWPANAETWK